MSHAKKKREGSEDEKPWMVFRWCECPTCRGVSEAPCERRGGYFWGDGAPEELRGKRPYWTARKERDGA